MRYAEGPTAEVEISIDAPVEVVWELVRDVHLPARFSDVSEGGERLDRATDAVVGARLLRRNRHPLIGEWTTVSTITDFEEGRHLAWAVSEVDNPASTWRFDVRAGAGVTVLRQRVTLG